MRFHALATDYDETLAEHGRVADATFAALERLRASGRAVLLVTGRDLEDLAQVCPRIDLFDAVVAENGAVLHVPSRRETRALAEPPPRVFAERLAARGVTPLSTGRVIVATREPWHGVVLEAIRDLGLELQVIFNKGAVMVLPSGTNKGTGLDVALAELGLSRLNTVGVGDAENDHVFLGRCGLGAAVANALPTLRERADMVTAGLAGAGVRELCAGLLEDDLQKRATQVRRHDIILGTDESGGPFGVPAYGGGILFAGPSGGGKSTAAKGFIERMIAADHQVLIIDPEGDYESFERIVCLGDASRPPTVEEVLRALAAPRADVVANLVAMPFADRPRFLAGIMPRVLEQRARSGRPHWVVLDEAHHLAPAANQKIALGTGLPEVVLITVLPHEVAPALLELVGTVVAVGDDAGATLADFGKTVRAPVPPSASRLGRGEVIAWQRGAAKALRLKTLPTRAQHQRHLRKYAEGQLADDRSFTFRGPDGKLKLRAHNLLQFADLADGVDDDTWLYHLRGKEVARWFRHEIKDDELAAEAEAAESLGPDESRRRIRAAIEKRYTLPPSA